jgi:adenylosuccinate synthase
MPALVVVGAQWGDEGKGKIIHFLGARADVIVRYQGGPNAGHTLILDGKPFVLHLVPSGIVLPGKKTIIGHGVVLNPEGLREEVRFLEEKGYRVGRRLQVSLGAHVILPFHRHRDKIRESGMQMIGTTQRGIGPCYEDKVARVGIRVADYLNAPLFKRLLEENLKAHAVELKPVGSVAQLRKEIMKDYASLSRWLRPFAGDTVASVHKALDEGRWILFEGAQGAMLDLDTGTYPYVTSSNPSSGGACVGSGVGPTAIDDVIGVTKAYTTRVGLGPFPTEIQGTTADYLREKGREYGATTGRPRRIGWLDMVQLRRAIKSNGIQRLALTKLDTLAHVHPIKICTAYRYKGKRLTEFPIDREAQLDAEPVYDTMAGFAADISGVTSLADLPSTALHYIRRIEREAGVPVSLLSLGPSREKTIVLDRSFAWARKLPA